MRLGILSFLDDTVICLPSDDLAASDELAATLQCMLPCPNSKLTQAPVELTLLLFCATFPTCTAIRSVPMAAHPFVSPRYATKPRRRSVNKESSSSPPAAASAPVAEEVRSLLLQRPPQALNFQDLGLSSSDCEILF